ncbi:MAG: hypothetical protein DRO05_02415 [Thermoproteota archaeon]|nr:MAG: hypothetical protein DRO05_02415 [Candidatus Korarchaeota archaeon]
MAVSPGFIDMHSHDDLIFFRDVYNRPKLLQGVTTVVIGSCGLSPAPLSQETLHELRAYLLIKRRHDRTQEVFIVPLDPFEDLLWTNCPEKQWNP